MSRQPIIEKVKKIELIFEDPDWDTFRPSMWKRIKFRYQDKKLSATLIQTQLIPNVGSVHCITFEEIKPCQG